MPEVAAEALKTWNRHLDFITPQHIITALVCDDFSDDQRAGLARALLELLPARVVQLPPIRVAYPGHNFSTNDVFWPADNALPDLHQFVTGDSFLIPNIMELTSADLQAWLEAPVAEWSDDRDSPHFKFAFWVVKEFAAKVQFTNDAAER